MNKYSDILSSESEIMSSESDEDSQEMSDFVLSDTSSSESEEEEIKDNTESFSWQKYSRQWQLQNMIPESTEDVKIHRNIRNLKSPTQFFELFFTNEVLEEISASSDCYYKEKHGNKHKQKSHHKQWQKPTINELKTYIGILIYMGLVSKPSIRMYWRLEESVSKSSLKSYMTEERFNLIRRNLHLNNDDNQIIDNLKSIAIFTKQLTQKFQLYYSPEHNLCIDESMIKFKGRTKIKVYLPLKPIRYGMKVYVLAESSSGYILNMELYNGKSQKLVTTINNLVSPYRNKGYTIAFDRFYCSIDVISNLTTKGFCSLGVCMKNRLRLTQAMNAEIQQLDKHQYLFYINNNKDIQLTIWRDSKTFSLLSNFGDNSIGYTSRQIQDKQQQIPCPNSIILYQKIAKGVDILDQMIQYYKQEIKSQKWHQKVTDYLFQIAIYNSYILFKKVTKQKLTLLQYQTEIMENYMKELPNKQKKIENKFERLLNEYKENTQICKLEHSYKQQCYICENKSMKKITSYYCKTHSQPVCILNCYDIHVFSVVSSQD